MTRPRFRTHYRAAQLCNGHPQSICGQFRPGVISTDVEADVDCELCLHQLERRRTGPPPASDRGVGKARYRAMKTLAERHPDEYRRLLDQALTADAT